MCGIVGYYPVEPDVRARAAFQRLFRESVVRGMHAYGLAQPTDLPQDKGHRSYYVIKAFDIAEILKEDPWQFDYQKPNIAHARYCQSGDWHNHDNNQPLVATGRALAMNGVLHMGTKAEFEAAYGVTCEADNDSEIFLQRLEQGESPEEFIKATQGSFAAVWLEGNTLFAGRNWRRPLWYCFAYGAHWYVSTGDIIRRAGIEASEVREVRPNAVEKRG